MTRITRAAWGLSGWAARLLYVAGFVTGAYGVYLALLSSLGQRDPGHQWLVGAEFMGLGFAASILGHIAVFRLYNRRPEPPDSDTYEPWYWIPYAVFLLTGIALLLASCGFRLIGDWERSNVTVVGTFSNCMSQDTDDGTTYTCTYDFDWQGGHYATTGGANGVYEDGTPVVLYLDPVTVRLDDHDAVPIVFAFIGGALFGLFDLFLCAVLAHEIYKLRRNFSRWLADMAWWRPPPRPAPPSPPPPAPEPLIEDAVPVDSRAEPWVEDARPPGY
jgi:hypothetical protein